MDRKEIEQLIIQGETSRLEFKSSDNHKDEINQAVCSFANDLPNSGVPGYVLIGVNNKGKPTGFRISDQLLNKLSSMRSDGNILPAPIIGVEKNPIFGTDIAVIEVFPSDSPPVRYKGVVHVSVGPTRRIATAEEERRLTERRRAGNLSFDLQPVPTATVGDLDIEIFNTNYLTFAIAPEVLDENKRTLTEQLVSLRFLKFDNATPTNAGLLVIGKDPRAWLPGAYIQFVSYEGTDLTGPIKDNKEISGNLIAQLARIRDVIPNLIKVAQTSPDEIVHIDHPDYPVAALSELIYNAVLHRNYEGTGTPIRIYQYNDRIEITSPGGLYGIVNADNYDRTTDYRNPVLAEAMKVLGYVQRFGVGIQKAKKTLKENGNPPPEFTFEPTHVSVTIRSV